MKYPLFFASIERSRFLLVDKTVSNVKLSGYSK